jgi:hypothetical protein
MRFKTLIAVILALIISLHARSGDAGAGPIRSRTAPPTLALRLDDGSLHALPTLDDGAVAKLLKVHALPTLDAGAVAKLLKEEQKRKQ